MTITRRGLLGTAAVASALPLVPARAQKASIKIGVMNDMSGQYRDTGGPTSVVCVRQALEDFGVSAKNFDVEVLSGDHLNKPDVGATIARQWYDRDGVDMIIDVPTSSVALAVQQVAREKNKVYINVGAATTELTGPQCSPVMIHWSYDTYMLAKSTGGAMVKSGGDTWYFITADYAFGQQLRKDTSALVNASGGKVLGDSPYPFPDTTDFSAFLVQAQASGAKVLGLANASGDTVNCIKQAHEFGTNKTMKIAALLLFINNVNALGLDIAQGLNLTESFYWDLNDKTRGWTKRVLPKTPSNYPNMIHAGCYAGTLHYLKAAIDMGIAEAKVSGKATVDRMKAMPFDDECFGHGTIRADGRVLVPSYLFQVKKPSESKGPWDYFNLVATTPGDQAFRPLNEGNCPFIQKS